MIDYIYIYNYKNTISRVLERLDKNKTQVSFTITFNIANAHDMGFRLD